MAARSASQRLEEARHPSVPRLISPVLADPDPMIAAAAIRTLGDVTTGRSTCSSTPSGAVKVSAPVLRRSSSGWRRRRVRELLPLLRDWNPIVRFWGATLLRPYPDLAVRRRYRTDLGLRLRTCGPPPSRRSVRGTAGRRRRASARLDDSEWFVRVHAARPVGHVVGVEAAPTITRLLADQRWWVRTAAKDALRGIGADAVPSLSRLLAHEDPFARNGAAEVLQDVGVVDDLAHDNPALRCCTASSRPGRTLPRGGRGVESQGRGRDEAVRGRMIETVLGSWSSSARVPAADAALRARSSWSALVENSVRRLEEPVAGLRRRSASRASRSR